MNREEAVDKIRKMMNLANDGSASEGEVENAVRFARRLMDQFNVTDSECNRPVESTDIGDHEAVTRITFDQWEKSLAMVIKEVCDVGVYYAPGTNKNALHFVGTERDVAIGKELFTTLMITVKSMARLKQGPGWTVSHRSYCLGFVDSLVDKARDEKRKSSAEAGAIVLCKGAMIRKWMDENLRLQPEAPTSNVDQHAYQRGRADGRLADIGTTNRLRAGAGGAQ